MAVKRGSRKIAGSTRVSAGSGKKDKRIAGLENRITALENELQSCRANAAPVDVVELKQARERLRADEERYRSLIERTGDWVWETDQDFVLTYDSPKGREILGYEPDEVIGRSPFSLMPEDELERIKLIAWPVIARHEPLEQIENRLIKKDGSIAIIETTCIPLFDDSGRYRGYRGVNRDITERKQAEEALRKSEKFLNNVLDSIQDGISILDKDLNIIRVNHVLEEWHPYMMPFRGKKCYYVYHLRSAPCEVCPSLKAMSTKTVQSDIVPRHGENDELTGWLEIYSFPLMDEAGNVTGVIEHVRDITDRKIAEDALQEARAKVELYLDLMGHDINNMHQIALGYLELARDMSPESGQRKFLDKSVEVLQRSAQLIRNVRKLQKLSDGMAQGQDVDVCRVLSEVQREFGMVLGKTVILNLNGHEHCHVRANELLHDLFANLVSNAIKHTRDRADIIIDMDVVKDKGGRYCRVMVEDNGPGIPDDFKGRIFNRMLKGNSKAKGMGLGLYLVKSLVESYGGRVWVEDRVPGDYTKGARFVVMLPAVVCAGGDTNA